MKQRGGIASLMLKQGLLIAMRVSWKLTGGWIGQRSKKPSADMSTDEEEHVTGRSIRSVRFFRRVRSHSRLGKRESYNPCISLS